MTRDIHHEHRLYEPGLPLEKIMIPNCFLAIRIKGEDMARVSARATKLQERGQIVETWNDDEEEPGTERRGLWGRMRLV